MAYELTWLTGTLLVLSGVFAGFINALAGGGSFLTLPALMLMGLPADIANATNRVGIVLQSLEGVRGFNRYGKLSRQAVLPILMPTIAGSLVGALVASFLPVSILKPVLLTTLIGMALLMVLWPSSISPQPDEQPRALKDTPAGVAGLFVAGLYGGFVQAGVGFVLIAVLAGILRYDLVRSNALKLTATAVFSGVALVVFVLREQVLWVPGLLLALGTVTGVNLSVRFAINVSQNVLRWILLVMVVAVCLAVWFS